MKIKKNVAISESGYIFNPSTGESFTVNPIGIEILNMIKNENQYEEISKTMMAKYNIDEDTFEKDFHDFAGILRQHMIIDTENEE